MIEIQRGEWTYKADAGKMPYWYQNNQNTWYEIHHATAGWIVWGGEVWRGQSGDYKVYDNWYLPHNWEVI